MTLCKDCKHWDRSELLQDINGQDCHDGHCEKDVKLLATGLTPPDFGCVLGEDLLPYKKLFLNEETNA